MANEKVSAMPDIAALVASDIVPVVRSGDPTNYSATMTEVAAFAGANITVAAGSLIGNPGTASGSGVSLAMAAGLKYDATLDTVSSAIAPVYYFNYSVPDLTPGLISPTSTTNDFRVASRYPSGAAENSLTYPCTGTTNNVVARFITPIGDTAATASPTGLVSRSFWVSVDAGVAHLDLRTRVLHVDGTFTVIGATASPSFSSTTPIQMAWTAFDHNGGQAVQFLPTDRVYFELIATRVSGPSTVNVTILFEGTTRYGTATTNIAQNAEPDVWVLNVNDFGAVGNLIALADGIIAAGTNVLTSATAKFSQNDVGKSIAVTGANGLASPPFTGTIASVTNTNTLVLSGTVSVGTTGIQYFSTASIVTGGATGYYSPGVDTITLSGGTFSVQAVANVVTTQVNPDTDTSPAFTIASAGSGGTPGSYLFVTTTQTGVPAYFRGTVGAGGTLESIDAFVRGGIFITNPGTAGEPITTASGTPSSGLTGATVNITSIGVLSVSVNTAGIYTVVPSDPVDTGAGSTSGATGCQLDVNWGSTGRFAYFTNAQAAIASAMTSANTIAGRGARAVVKFPDQIYGITGSELPIFTTPVLVRGAGLGQSMVYAAEGYTGRQIFAWSGLFPASGTSPVGGPSLLASSTPDGAGLIGMTLLSDRTNTVLPDGIRIYDRCTGMIFRNISVQNMGAAFRCGLINTGRQGLLRESLIEDFNTLNCGSSTLPSMWIDSVGIGQGSNFLRFDKLNVIGYISSGIALTNHMLGNKRNSMKTFEFGMVRIESPVPALGDAFQVGSFDSLSSITNITIDTLHTINPTTGRAGLAFYAPSANTRANNFNCKYFYQTGASLGYGVAIYAGTGISIGVGQVTARTAQFLTGNHSDNFLATTVSSATSSSVTVATGVATTDWYVGAAAVHSVPCSFTGSIATSAGVSTLTVTAVASGRLLVGSIIPTAGTVPNCTITSLGSGSGGTGTYIVTPAQGTVTSRAMTAQYSATRNITAWSTSRVATIGAVQGSNATWDNVPISGETIQFQSLVDPDIFLTAEGEEPAETYSSGTNPNNLWLSYLPVRGLPTSTGTISRVLSFPSAASFSNAIITGGTLDGLNLTGMTANNLIYSSGASAIANLALDSHLAITSGTLTVSGFGAGTVTSVSFTGGLISVANPTTTPAFTVAGTSGGIPVFSSNSTWSSSTLLTTNSLVLGGGATVGVKTSSGLVSNGVGQITLGAVGVGTGAITMNGSAAGSVAFTIPNTVGSSYNFVMPASAGSAGQFLTSQGGGTTQQTWTSPSVLFTGKKTSPGGISWGGGAVATAGTISWAYEGENMHITGADYSNGSGGGTITAAVNIGGTTITGLGTVAISTTSSATATANNALVAGNVINVVLTSATGTISESGYITFKGTVD